jgi:hypothetical protein
VIGFTVRADMNCPERLTTGLPVYFNPAAGVVMIAHVRARAYETEFVMST